MSTLEKFGILVILILVVIIGVVAVWGVGGEKDNPFAQEPAVDGAIALDGGAAPATEPGKGVPEWTNGTPPDLGATAPVAPPALGVAPSVAGTGPAPASTGVTTWTVKKGDTGASIAKATLGSAAKWPLISDANGKKDPRRLKIGEVLNIPGGGVSMADTGPKAPRIDKSIINPNDLVNTRNDLMPTPVNPADGPTDVRAPVAVPASSREVEVKSGDTLYEIARRELGDANLYYKIIKANPGLDPKKIRPGMKIKLPAL